ncbi:hypothetical protein [Amycolatopsis sp. FDAARGOS 1241]|uniref:hypothetical protein n=1 Tax=Amycolatopsis sp. FDAARGOS 1241 TaxID=2778070 RepID=UPI001950E37A|nr:hypothetical protein [Amycolatopsis sp. FDAARGOS 1241]QRP46359.1 hypothetical protein I6J71_46380 [Amycolatopsis sp. FDAARGOS 1241]
MSSAEALGSRYDVETGLQELMSRGYQFVHQTDASGEVEAVVGVRVHDNVVDVVRLNAEDDVVATRLPGTEDNVFAPEKWLWRRSGDAAGVLTEVLALPDEAGTDDTDDTATAPAKGCWVPGRGGTSKWLAAR